MRHIKYVIRRESRLSCYMNSCVFLSSSIDIFIPFIYASDAAIHTIHGTPLHPQLTSIPNQTIPQTSFLTTYPVPTACFVLCMCYPGRPLRHPLHSSFHLTYFTINYQNSVQISHPQSQNNSPRIQYDFSIQGVLIIITRPTIFPAHPMKCHLVHVISITS